MDGAGCWGSLILVRDRGRPDFDPETMGAVERLAGTLVQGLRRTVVAQQATIDQTTHGPGLVVLDRHGQVESLTPAARHWLDHLGQDPPVLTRWPPRPASGPTRARGPYPHRAVAHPARRPAGRRPPGSGVGDHRAAPARRAGPAAGRRLWPLGREQAVAALVFQGRSTRQIARALSISPYTVQEHLTAVFDKVGVRSRGELVGQVFFRHCLPAIPD